MDTTQDIAKVDQLSQVIRYVIIEQSESGRPTDIKINESFLGFKKVEDGSAVGLQGDIIDSIKSKVIFICALFCYLGIDLSKCRGQGYDGAAVMSGPYSGVQKRILDEVDRAVYVHCAAHNLNLVLNDAMNGILEIGKFFASLEKLYAFFAVSIKRWTLLSEILSSKRKAGSLQLKRLCPTRWSSRNYSLLAIRFSYADILQALAKIILTSNNASEQTDASNLKKDLESFEFVFQVVLHTKILIATNGVSQNLQKSDFDLWQARDLLQAARKELEEFRGEFEKAKSDAVELAKSWGVRVEFGQKRVKKTKRHFDELCEDQRLSDGDKRFKVNVFLACLDIAISQLNHRFVGLNQIVDSFAIIQPQVLLQLTAEELAKECDKFREKYYDD
ncbi:hypothetical protein ILUMI_24954, partial [Ignelater luminosus]